MKLLHVIPTSAPESGGPIEGVRQRGRKLLQMGHSVEIASLDDPTAVKNLTPEIPLAALGPGVGSFRYSPRLAEWLKENVGRFDGVVVNGIWQYHGVAARQACRAANVPYFVFAHGMLDPWFKAAYPLKHIKKSLFWPWQHAVLRDARAVLFTTEEERTLAAESFKPFHVNARVVAYGTAAPPPACDAQRVAFLSAVPDAESHKVLLFLGRIHEKKGIDMLIRAFSETLARDPDWILVIAGPDLRGLRPSLERLAEQSGVANAVRWPGMLVGDAKWGAHRAATGFILPSHQENFGISLAEALACGTPVMTTNRVNIWREVESDGAALVGDDTVEGISDLLRRFSVLTQDQLDEMGERGRSTFERRFALTPMAEGLIEVISENLDRKP